MPRILITGNGFDLHHNLPTKYEDFMNISKFILENEERTHDKQSYDFHSIYSKVGAARFEEMKNTFQTNVKFDEGKIQQLYQLLKGNKFFSYFQKQHEIDTWIDFESRLEYALNQILIGVKNFRQQVIKQGKLYDKSYYNLSDFGKQHSAVRVLKHFDVLTKGTLIKWKKEFLAKDGLLNLPIDINEQNLANALYEDFSEFNDIFNFYLQVFVFPLYSFMEEKDQSFPFELIDHHFTFNYTPTAEKVGLKSAKTQYLHGQSNWEGSNIVFGIDDVPDEDENKFYIKFTKFFQKTKKETDFYFLSKIKQSSKELYRFYFWGHSLDVSDKSYILEIFAFIESLADDCKKVIIIYHSENSRSNSLINLIRILGREKFEENIRKNILLFYQSGSKELELEMKMELEIYF